MPVRLSSSYFTFDPFGISMITRKSFSMESPSSTSCQGCMNRLLSLRGISASWYQSAAAAGFTPRRTGHFFLIGIRSMEAREDERESEMLEDFASAEIQTGETPIFVRSHGSGPPLLLLHGFPQTHVMWRGVAPRLARDFTVVCADLRGYGHSGCPVSTPDHAPYAKRAMAQDMVAVMEGLG